MDSFLKICGIIFLFLIGIVIVGFIISFIVVGINDEIDRHYEAKFGNCPLNPDSYICDVRKQRSKLGYYNRRDKVVNCFECPRFKKERDKKLGLYKKEETKDEI